MFETTSWAYVHDLYVGFAELTIENATHRIIREVDHGYKGETHCEIDLGEWIDIGEGRSVPQHLRFRFPGQQFTVDDRFEWRPERLWALKSGESRFDGKGPERETIADLAINAPVPALEAGLNRANHAVAALEAPTAIKPDKRSLVTGRFALGVKVPLAGGRLQSLAFTFHRDDDDAREPLRRWDHPHAPRRAHTVPGRTGAGRRRRTLDGPLRRSRTPRRFGPRDTCCSPRPGGARPGIVQLPGFGDSLGRSRSCRRTDRTRSHRRLRRPERSPKRSRCVLARFRSYRSTPCRIWRSSRIRPRSPASPRRGSAPSSSPTTAKELFTRHFGARES